MFRSFFNEMRFRWGLFSAVARVNVFTAIPILFLSSRDLLEGMLKAAEKEKEEAND